MLDPRCPRCREDQRAVWAGIPVPELEGRDWYCPGCRAYLMILNDRISIVQVPPPQDPGQGRSR